MIKMKGNKMAKIITVNTNNRLKSIRRAKRKSLSFADRAELLESMVRSAVYYYETEGMRDD